MFNNYWFIMFLSDTFKVYLLNYIRSDIETQQQDKHNTLLELL